MKTTIVLLNQLFEVKLKIEQEKLTGKFERNFERIFSLLEEEGYLLKNPIGESYSDSRTDVEANVVGVEEKKMVITKVIKPIIYQKDQNTINLIQKGVVIVEKA